MKILHVIPYFNPKRGGDVNVCASLSKEFVNKGHEVTIITTDFEFNEEYVKSIESQGINLIYFKTVFNIGLITYSPSMKNWLKTHIQEYDIIHLHTVRSYQNNLIQNYCQKYGVPYILQAHGSLLPNSQKPVLKKFYDFFWGHRILNDAYKVIALTETEKKQYIDMGVAKNKIEMIPNGINLSKFKNIPKKGKFRNKYNIEKDEKIILYLGRIHETKGIELAIESFSNILNNFKKIKLVISGPDDGFLHCLNKLIMNLDLKDQIIFTGPIYQEDKLEAYVDADVFITPKFSGFPITFLESCACGTPIITTNNGDNLDWIDENVGLVVEYNKNQLSSAMVSILNNENLKIKFENNAQNLVKKQFNWQNITKILKNVYETSINENRI